MYLTDVTNAIDIVKEYCNNTECVDCKIMFMIGCNTSLCEDLKINQPYEWEEQND